MTETPKLQLPGDGGVCGPENIIVYAAVPFDGSDAVLLGWSETGELFGKEVETVESSLLVEYELDNPPGFGIWAFEGQLKVTWCKSGDPMEPQDYEHAYHWLGEWRGPSDEEMLRWSGRKPKHTSYEIKDDESFSFQCPGTKDDPKLKEGWKVFCKLKRGHDGPHNFGGETVLDEIVDAVGQEQ